MPSSYDKTSQPFLWITTWSQDTLPSVGRRFISSNQISFCADDDILLPFTKIESNTNRVVINFQSTSDGNETEDVFEFLVLLSANPQERTQTQTQYEKQSFVGAVWDIENSVIKCSKPNDEIQCLQRYGQTVHYSCVPNDVLCNCGLFKSVDEVVLKSLATSDSPLPQALTSPTNPHYNDICYPLRLAYDNDESLLGAKKSNMCEYYAELNRRCRTNSSAYIAAMTTRSVKIDASNSNIEPSNGAVDQSFLDGLSLFEDEYNAGDSGYENELGINNNNNDMNRIRDDIGFDTPANLPTDFASVCTNVLRTSQFGWIASPNFYE